MREMKDSGIEWIGEVPSHWEIRKIKQLKNPNEENSFEDGDWIESPYITDNGIRYLTTGNIGDGIFKYQGTGYISLETFAELNCKYAYPNDLVFSRLNAPYGRSCILPNMCSEYVLAVDNVILRTEQEKRYICYITQCNGYQHAIEDEAKGTTMKRISRTNLGNIKIVLPPLSEQQAIADFLDRRCAEIDAVIEQTKATIEEYRKLKQSVITEAVTKGIRGDRPMKDSGIEWIGEIPREWDVVRIKNLFDYRNERNEKPLEEVNLISLYTDLGVVQHCDLEATTGNKASNADGYKLVYEDDIVVNIILCWMGAIGRSAYTGVTSPAYDVYSPKKETNSKFYHHLFRTQGFSGDCYKVGRGIMAMRWRTYSDQFRAIKVVAPPKEEQEEIVEYLDQKCAEIDALIEKKTALLSVMETYKKSLIFEYVTGKKEVATESEQTVTVVYPYFPSVLATNKPRFAQAVLMSKILDSNVSNMGRVKLEKMLFTIEHSLGFDFDTEYHREAAGPLDGSIYECERVISRANKWFYVNTSSYGVSYKPQKDMGKYKKYYDKYFYDYNEEIERIIAIFRNYSLDQAEIIATLYGAWNDFIIDKREYTDEDIVNEVLTNWNESKKRFPKDVWLRAIESMKKNDLVPKGYGKHTVIKSVDGE